MCWVFDNDEDIEEQKQVFKQARDQVLNNVFVIFALLPRFIDAPDDIGDWNYF